jgi:predicted flap endonuclease-1-like 5' DNA nuclease
VVEELGGEDVLEDYEVEATEGAASGASEPVEQPSASAATEQGDDLTVISGIGPKSAAVLQVAGIDSYARLAATSEPDLRRILKDGDASVPKSVGTWAMQASFAANGDWRGLDAFMRHSQAEPATRTGAAAALPDDLTQLAGIGPKSARALTRAGITTYAALAKANESQLRRALLEADMLAPADIGTWPSQAGYAAKGDWQGLSAYNKKQSQGGTRKAKGAAASPSAQPTAVDDLTQLSGIGPRMASILSEGGVTSYDGLQHASTEELRQIVSKAGVLPPSSLDTWPAQAAFAARADWRGLTEYNKRHAR